MLIRLILLIALALAAAVAVSAQEAGAPMPNDENTGAKRLSFFGEKLTFGFTTGATVTPDYRTGYEATGEAGGVFIDGKIVESATAIQYIVPNFTRPLVGVFAETKLTRNFSLQATVLFRALGWKLDLIFPDHDAHELIDGKSQDIWEIPVLFKYRFGTSKVRPFLGAGPTFRINKAGRNPPRPYGAAAALGVDIPFGRRWTITPQVNYTHWSGGESLSRVQGHRARNQVQALISFSF